MADLKTDLKLVPSDPFDPAALRFDQSFTEGPAVKRLLTAIPVRKPGGGFCACPSGRGISSRYCGNLSQ
jgi:hypothetical protein